MNERAIPETKKMPMPSSAKTNAVALETDLKDRSAVVESTTRTRRDGGCDVVEPCTQFLSQAGIWTDNASLAAYGRPNGTFVPLAGP